MGSEVSGARDASGGRGTSGAWLPIEATAVSGAPSCGAWSSADVAMALGEPSWCHIFPAEGEALCSWPLA